MQRQMTEWMLQQICGLRQPNVGQNDSKPSTSIPGNEISVEIRFSGGSHQQMCDWLGSDWRYVEQGGGDLGDRLMRAFQSSFEQGAKAVVVIGIDCPGVTPAVLMQAYSQLKHHDGVLGPAADGGYYLIGLRQLVPELFTQIQWGTETVRQVTLAKAESLGMAIAQLDVLNDVDYPEDLIVWQSLSGKAFEKISGQLSVVIPVLNESEHIEATIQQVQDAAGKQANLDIIVVDGGSVDNTVERAKATNVRVIPAASGRANQMNAGASIATGEYLLFLHADTQLPAEFYAHIRQCLSAPNTVAGAFELSIQGTHPGLRWVECGVKWRSRLFYMPYGDQAIFLRTDTFREMGGFPRLPIMEDFELIRNLKRRGNVAIAPATVRTSGRRWQRLGIIRTTLINQAIIIGYLSGIPTKQLAEWYRRGTTRPKR